MDNFDLKKFLVENKLTPSSQKENNHLNEMMWNPPSFSHEEEAERNKATPARAKEKWTQMSPEERADKKLNYIITQANRTAKALGKDISKEIEAIKSKHANNVDSQMAAIKRLASKLNKERISKL